MLEMWFIGNDNHHFYLAIAIICSCETTIRLLSVKISTPYLSLKSSNNSGCAINELNGIRSSCSGKDTTHAHLYSPCVKTCFLSLRCKYVDSI